MRSPAAQRSPAFDQLAVIESIQQGIASKLDFQGIVDLVGDKLRKVFETGDIGIWWWDANTHVAHPLYLMEHGVRLAGAPFPVDQSPAAQRLAAGEVVVANNRAEYARRGFVVMPGSDQGHSCAGVPIVAGDRVIGSVLLENHERENAFGVSEVRLLNAITASMGIALENARLFSETQDALARQTATADILRVISRSPTDVQPVFDAIAERARVLCNAIASGVLRYDGEWVHMVAYQGVSAEADEAMRSVFPMRPGAMATTAAKAI
ncbi:MAG TPA: GAF domain-containing protein, partial [Casimicrobiaceae bacterium]|nr:GAF domain-containing protein [Casimicrobiaceae bacterium]